MKTMFSFHSRSKLYATKLFVVFLFTGSLVVLAFNDPTTADKSNFVLFTPKMIPQNLVVVQPWLKSKEFRIERIVYRVMAANEVYVSITEKAARERDLKELFGNPTGPNGDFYYENVSVNGFHAVLITGAYDLPHRVTSFDPRKSTHLYLVRDNTLIDIQSTDNSIFSRQDLISFAQVLEAKN
jgi:hypothetical protein